MGNMQTQCFHNGLSVLKIKYIILIDVRSKKLTCFFQLQNLIHRFTNLSLRIRNICQIQNCGTNGIRILDSFIDQRLHQWNHIVDDIIHNMYGSAVDIHDNVISITFILMYHGIPFI